MKGFTAIKHLWFWLLVPIVVVLEVTLQWWIPRQDPTDADWKAAVRAVEAQKQPGDLLVIAPAWAVQGRMYFEDFMTFKAFGRFDTTGYKRLIEVSVDGAKSPESKEMTPENTMRFGPLTVNRYRLPTPAKILYNFVDQWKDAMFDNTDKQAPKLVIDHWFNPRRVLELSLHKTSSLTFKDVPLGGVLRGYAVIGYREGRFDEGAPIRLRIFLDDKKIGEEMVANFSPIEPYTYPLPGTGTGTIRFEAYAKDNKKREFGIAADIREEAQ